MHEVSDSLSDYTWDDTDEANFQVYIERDRSQSSRAKFILETCN